MADNAEIVDPFDEPYDAADSEYAQPVAVDNKGLIDPYDEPVSRGTDPTAGYNQATTGTRAMADIVREKSDPSTWERATNLVTGADRQTQATEDLPELINSGLLSDAPWGHVMRVAPALATTFDPVEQADIIQSNFPQIKRIHDEKGNIILVNENTGAHTLVNAPGLSAQDIYQGSTVAAEYFPASRAAGAATTMPRAMGRVGTASAATETANQAVQAASGGSFDTGEIAVVGIGGGVFEGIGIILAKAFAPVYNRTATITPEMRETFRESARQVGIDPEQMTDDVIRSYLDSALVATESAPRGEFGIRYTQGQRSGDVTQLAREERLARGPNAQARQTMEDFAQDQRGDVMRARGDVQEQLGTGGAPIERPVEAGEQVIEGVRTRAQQARTAIDDAYTAAGEARAALTPQGQKMIVTRLQRIAKVDQFDMHPETAPMTARTMKELGEMADFLEETGGRMQSLKHVERWRRRINKRIDGAQGEDLNQMLRIKREFDDQVGKAIDRALFTGDDEALELLKEARGLYTDYRVTFTRQDTRMRSGGKIKDRAGELIQKMAEADPTPEEVINYLYGTARLGKKQDAAAAIHKIKRVVGPESEEFGALRQAAFLRLTDPGRQEVFSGAKFLTNLTDMIDNAPSVMDALFTKEEQALLLRFGRAVKQAQPDPQYPSKTPHGNAAYVAELWGKVLPMLGFAAGGPGGAATATGGRMAAENIGRWRSNVLAERATSQLRPLSRIPIGGVAAGSEPGRNITGAGLEGAGETAVDVLSKDVGEGRRGGAL